MTSTPVVLIGLSGSGKSTVAVELAKRLNRPLVDLDALIVEVEGRSVDEIFVSSGEPYFRAIEARLFKTLVQDHPEAIIASGGGLVTTPANLKTLDASCFTIWLNPPLAEIKARLAESPQRPLVGTPDAIETLHADRLGVYSVAADFVYADVADPDTVGSELAEVVAQGRRPQPSVEEVALGPGRSYPVLIGRGVANKLAAVVPSRVKRVAIVSQEGIDVEIKTGVEQKVFLIEKGEQAKRLGVAEQLASDFAQWGLTRNDAVVSVGGGVVSDLAGFVAACYHRGLPVAHVSTTLLGQIDAAIGGKTGVNLVEGKNLFGAFWQPSAVICDINHLATLPPREFRAGMGELAKYHFLGGGQLDRIPLVDRVAACVRIKADIVASDEREGGRRAILNYGHTLAHALETVGAFELRHGEAVAIGLVYAAELAARLGRIDDKAVAEHRRIVETYGLSATLPDGVDLDEVVMLFGRDKKAVNGVTFVLDGPDGVEPVRVDDEALLRSTLEAVR